MKSLLEYLQDGMNYAYLSDLRNCEEKSLVAGLIEDIPADRFLVREWCDAADYVCGQRIAQAEAEAARKELLRVLTKES